MFDLSFFKLVVVAVVALIVLGPERLPKVARTAGILFSRLQRYASSVKADISRELELEELRRLRKEVEESARQIERTVKQELHSVEQAVQQPAETIEQEIEQARQQLESIQPGGKTAAPGESGEPEPVGNLTPTEPAQDSEPPEECASPPLVEPLTSTAGHPELKPTHDRPD